MPDAQHTDDSFARLHADAHDACGSHRGRDNQRRVCAAAAQTDRLARSWQIRRPSGLRSGRLQGNSLLFWCEPLLDDAEARQDCLFAGRLPFLDATPREMQHAREEMARASMKRLIECVPNFSEGRDAAKVDALVTAMSGVPGVFVLDRELDADHNRCVITLAGEPDAVAEAALLGVGKALELINLTQHTGAHPRVGATDVVPFIPVEGVTLEDCVALARRVGNEIWQRYRIPVYFYEAAATRPDRTNLENIRRGQFEGLREELEHNRDRHPDVGEPKLHPTAGATVVGARKFLIAYNINLNTPDVSIAKKIAKAIRFSSGGLRYVKAMGVELKARNLAQVSINLTDFEQTPMHRVYEMVKREAERHGVTTVGSEIVGLVPKKALEMTADFFLQLENFSPAQVLENRLATALTGAPLESSSKDGRLAGLARQFLEAVAEPTATPGGGSASAFAGALAASLGQMVAGR